VEALEEVVRRIALTRPKDGEWERTWIALQERAKNVLGHADESYNHSSDDVDSPT
jgi:anti-sigma regulatory factor (Ser/Thr protein kinase)